MNLTNKKIILIYTLSPFLVGIFFWFFEIFYRPDDSFGSWLNSSIVHINMPFGYLIDYLQIISIVSGVCCAYSAISFLLLVIIPSRLILRLTIREGLISRLIKCIGILIGFELFLYIRGHNEDFLSMLILFFIYATGYVIFFYLVPKKITGLPEKQSHIDWFIHSILSGIIGVALFVLWLNLLQIKMGKVIGIGLTLPYILGFMGVLYFCIPAILTGVVKVKNIRVFPLNQTSTCGVVGFILSCIFGVILGPFFIWVGIAGGITGMLLAIMVDLINTPPVKQPEEINQQ